MKVRIGFVSNSSSSSYMILVPKEHDVLLKKLKKFVEEVANNRYDELHAKFYENEEEWKGFASKDYLLDLSKEEDLEEYNELCLSEFFQKDSRADKFAVLDLRVQWGAEDLLPLVELLGETFGLQVLRSESYHADESDFN